jgi:hypothetical protein
MYLIIFTIVVVILVGLLFLRREHLTLEELEKQLENSGPSLLSQYDRLQYEKRIKDSEAEAKPILESLQNSPGMETIRKRRRMSFKYKRVMDQAELNLKNFEEKYKTKIIDITETKWNWGKNETIIRKGLEDPVLDAEFIKLNNLVEKLNNEINNTPLTMKEGIIIEEPYLIQNIRNELNKFGFNVGGDDEHVKAIARSFNINTSSQLQQIKDSVADIKEKLRKDDELLKQLQLRDKRIIMQREREREESLKKLIKKKKSRESAVERMKRKRREKTIARKQIQAEEKAKAEAETKANMGMDAKTLAEREARERAEREARERAEREARERAEREARERAEREARERAEREANARKAEEAKVMNEEIIKINNARKEAEEALNQLREIPLEERLRRRLFVHPKIEHKPYPYIRSTPANPPYETTRYEKRENLFKTSEISSIFPRPII